MRSRDESGGCPVIGQMVSGTEVARACSAASAGKVGRRAPIRPFARCGRVARGRALGDRNREVLSTDAEPAGGPARSSAETPVTGVERRGRLILICSREQPGDVLGGDE